ncbi:MAG TPA: hypothetical protein VI565_02545 [Burkholderiales bacterium]|nr:hypothetical protein [Burkholderiales bacterium]
MNISSTPKTLSPPGAAARPVRLLRRLQNKGLALRKLHDRERRRLRQEVGRVPGLMAMLMKPRNGRRWTSAERETLREQLHSMRRLGLYVAVMLIPGTALTLPLLAWWLDRRHARRASPAAEFRESGVN